MEKNDEILTLNDLMEILKLTRRTLQDFIKKGKLKAFKVGIYWRVTRKSLEEYIERYTK